MSRMISWLYILLFGLTPLLVSPFSSELFELPKMYFIYALTGIILCLHLLSAINYQTPIFKIHKLNLPILLFLFSQVISFIFSIDKYTSFFGYYGRFNGGLLSTFCFTTLFFILVVHQTPNLRKKIIQSSIFTGLLISVYALFQAMGIDKTLWVQDVQSRVFSTLGQPNWLSAYLIVIFFITIANTKNIYFRLFFSTMLLVSIFLTKSQSGLLALGFSSVFYILLSVVFQKKTSFNFTFYLPFLLLLLILFTFPNPLKNRLFPTKSPAAIVNQSGEILNITDSKDIRFNYLWPATFAIFSKSPLWGFGPETFAYTYYWVRPTSHNLTSEWNFLYNKAHNEFLNILANTGLFGFISYCFLCLSILLLFFKTKSFALLASFLSILITNFFGFSTSIIALYFFLLSTISEKNS